MDYFVFLEKAAFKYINVTLLPKHDHWRYNEFALQANTFGVSCLISTLFTKLNLNIDFLLQKMIFNQKKIISFVSNNSN